MPDIKNKEKSLIRTKAKTYSAILSKIPFEQGTILHLKTYNAIALESARCRLCLICGKIGSMEDFENHKNCVSEYKQQKIPLIIKTSWYRLRDFFLSDEYCDFFRDLEIEEREIKKQCD